MPLNLCRDHCQPAWRSLSAATDAIGACHFDGGLYGLQVQRRERHAAPLQRAINIFAIQQAESLRSPLVFSSAEQVQIHGAEVEVPVPAGLVAHGADIELAIQLARERNAELDEPCLVPAPEL